MTLKNFASRVVLLGALAFSLFMSACAMKSETTSLQLTMPNWAALRAADHAYRSKVSTQSVAAADLSMIVVNVTGPGMSPVIWSWESDRGSATTAAVPPTVIPIQVSKGSDRLIQVLGIYSGGGSMEFFYGDSVVAIDRESVDVAMEISNVATAQGLVEGNVIGRWMPTATGGPTGRFQYRFQPSATKPSMVVHDGEVFGGWGRYFGFSSPLLKYTWLDGTPFAASLYNGNPDIHSASSPKRTLVARTPDGYKEHGDSSNPSYEFRRGRRNVVGYFGPFAGDRGVCYQNTAGNVATSKVKSYYQGASTAAPVLWNGTGSAPGSGEAYLERTSSGSVGGSTGSFGGIATSDLGSCSSAVTSSLGRTVEEWTDYVILRHETLADESALSFKGPFAATAQTQHGPSYLTLTHDAGTSSATISWKYLPGAATGGVGVFFRQFTPTAGGGDGESDFRLNGDGYRCNDLTNLGFGRADVNGNADSVVVTGVSASAFAQMQVVVCPIDPAKPGSFYNSGVAYTNYGGGQGGGGFQSAVRLAAFSSSNVETTPAARASVHVGTCYPVFVQAVSSSGQAGSMMGPADVTVTSPSANLFYSDGCSSVGSTSITLGGFNQARHFFVKPTGLGTEDLAIQPAASLSGGTLHLSVIAAQNADSTRLVGQSNVTKFACIPMKIEMQKEGVPALPLGPVDLDLDNNLDWEFYDSWNSSCLPSNMTNHAFTSYQTAKMLFVKYVGAASGNVSFTPDNADPETPTPTATNFNVSSPAVPTGLRVAGFPSSSSLGACLPVQVEPTDAAGMTTMVLSTQLNGATSASIDLSATGGEFHVSPGCGGMGAATTTVALTQHQPRSSQTYFKPTTTGTATVAAQIAGSTTLTGVAIANGLGTTNVGPAVAAKILVLAPGQTYTEGNADASNTTPVTQIRNVTFNVQLIAVTPDYQVADSTSPSTITPFNETISFVKNEPEMAEPMAPLSVTFSNGIATLPVKFGANAGGASRNVRLQVSSGGFPGLQIVDSAPYFPVLYNPDPVVASIYGKPDLVMNACQPYLIAFEDASGYAALQNSMRTITTAADTITSGDYKAGYTNTCSGATGPFAPFVGGGTSHIQTVYFKPLVSPVSFNMTVNDSSMIFANAARAMTSSSGSIAGNASHLSIWGSAVGKIGICMPLLIASTDAVGTSKPTASDPQVFMVTSNSGGSFYGDPFCTTSVPPNFTSAARSNVVYFLPSAAGAHVITASGAGLTDGTHAITVAP